MPAESLTLTSKKVTRARLAEWGFRRMPDVWLPSPTEGRNSYFERWYHAQWNFNAVIGWPDKDPLVHTEEDFLTSIQAHILESDGSPACDQWDELLCGF